MELFLPFPVMGSKNFFNKRIPIWSNDSKMVIRNRKWNYLNRKWNYFSTFQSSDQKTFLYKNIPIWFNVSKMVFTDRKWNYLSRKWNYFSPFQSWDQKTSLTKGYPFGPMIPKWLSRTGSGITWAGNGIISPLSSHRIKKLFFTKISTFGPMTLK